jgi:hypothetical protein
MTDFMRNAKSRAGWMLIIFPDWISKLDVT